MKCFLMHDWGKWETSKENWIRHRNGRNDDFVKTVQHRDCDRCGKRQRQRRIVDEGIK